MDGAEDNAFRQYLLSELTKAQKRRVAYHRMVHEHEWRLRHHNPQWQLMTKYLRNDQWDPNSDWTNVRPVPDNRRFPNDQEYQDRKDALVQNGIIVKCRVFLSQWDPRNPSLQIRVTRVRSATNPTWLSNRTEYKRNPYHITVGFLDPIKRHVPDWRFHLERLIRKFHLRTVHLRVFGFSSGGNVYLDGTHDPIATDPDFQILHNPHRTRNDGSIDYPHVTQ